MASVTKTYTASGSPDVTYEITVTTKRTSTTKGAVSVSCRTKLGSSSSLLGTGHKLVGYLYIPGVGEKTWTIKSSSSSWSGSGWHTSSASWSVSVALSTNSLSGFKFKAVNTYGSAGDLSYRSTFAVSIDSGTSYATTEHERVQIANTSKSQSKVVLNVSNIPSASYTRVICWYRGNTYINYTTISSTSHTGTFINLSPNTTYKFTAEIRLGSTTGAVIYTRSMTITTDQETASLKLEPDATYISAVISEMSDSPTYTRTLEFYLKKSSGAGNTSGGTSEYKLLKTMTSKGTSASVTITKLLPLTAYEVKVLVKNGSTVLKTLTGVTTTLADESVVPKAIIEEATQKPGILKCSVDWLVNKEVSGTVYKLQMYDTNTGSGWYDVDAKKAYSSPWEFAIPEEYDIVELRIASYMYELGEELTNYSNYYAFEPRFKFAWDNKKVAGEEVVMTAKEWNRLGEFVLARAEDKGVEVSLSEVNVGEDFSATVYNEMAEALEIVTGATLPRKVRGDAIKAADINILRTTINT